RVTDCTVAGNIIGLDVDGANAIPNQDGIHLYEGRHNTIGGDTPAARNVVSGNIRSGISVEGGGNIVRFNYVGTDVTGRRAIGNGLTVGFGPGIFTYSVGEVNEVSDNVVSGNRTGIEIVFQRSNVYRNLIGTDATGSFAVPNSLAGVFFSGHPSGSFDTEIGGPTSDFGNVIAGNDGCGILIGPYVGKGAVIRNNRIGVGLVTNGQPVPALGNRGGGIVVTGSVPTLVTGNTIANNGRGGVLVAGGAGVS